jgi:hypothetical protein
MYLAPDGFAVFLLSIEPSYQAFGCRYGPILASKHPKHLELENCHHKQYSEHR